MKATRRRAIGVIMVVALLALSTPLVGGQIRPADQPATPIAAAAHVRATEAHPATGAVIGWAGQCNFPTEGALVCANAPPAATQARAVFDNLTSDREIVVFGGSSAAGASMNETFTWKLGNWTQINANAASSGEPPQASNVSMVYDASAGYVLTFGGWSTNTAINESYRFSGGSWSKHNPPATLKVASGGCFVYIPPVGGGKGGYVLLFSGAGQTTLKAYTWTYTNGTWANVTATVTGGPPASRTNAMCAWNPVAQVVDLFGGWGGAHKVLNDLWTFNPATGTAGAWTQAIANNTAGSPPARQLGTFWYDSATGKMTLGGGGTGSALKNPTRLVGGFDTWTLLGSTWTNVTSLIHIPSAYSADVFGAASTFAPNYAYGWNFGGTTQAGPTSALVAEWGVRVTASLTLGPTFPQLNHTIYLNATALGGTGIYNFNWSGLPQGCAPSNLTKLVCTPTLGGVYNVTVNVTDTAGSPHPAGLAAPNVTLTLPSPLPSKWVNGTLVLGGSIGVHPFNPFLGFTQGPSSFTNGTYSAGAFINSTQFRYLRIETGGNGLNPTSNQWVAPPGGGAFTLTGAPTWNSSNFKAWFTSGPQAAGTVWIGYLPAQVNNTTFAVYTAKWFHNVYGLTPIAWQFGNEPQAWTHYGENFSSWSTNDNSKVTGIGYATMVKNYIAGVHAVFPNDTYIGIESAVSLSDAGGLIGSTISVNHASLAAIAYHEYPVPNATNPYGAVGAYYSSLTAHSGIRTSVAAMRSYLTANCAGNVTCLAMPIQLGEYQGGPASNFSSYDALYQGAVFMAASTVLSINSNLSTFQVFSFQSLYHSSVVSPEGLFFQRMLSNLTMGRDYAANVTGAGGGLFAVETTGAGGLRGLMIVNTNVTHNINVTLGSAFPSGSPANAWTWNPTWSWPNETQYQISPGVFSIPSQGILVLDFLNQSAPPPGPFPFHQGAGIVLVVIAGLAGVFILIVTSNPALRRGVMNLGSKSRRRKMGRFPF